VVKEIDPATLELQVPSMILQPLIENGIKHGLEPRISGGTITIRSRIDGGKLMIEVEDDGVGIAPGRPHSSGVLHQGTGIGMSNVRERLEVLFGPAAVFEVTSRPGRGTRITMEMPAAIYEDGETGSTAAPARSSTRS
jgi:two-component system LytT family sensor kinase